MRSIFRYPGGKSKSSITKWITAHKPATVGEYREPFVGGGGVFWSMPCNLPRWINDKHDGLIAVYLALRDRPDEFIDACQAIAPATSTDPQTTAGPRGGQPTNARLKATFDELCLNDDCDQALRYFFVNRTVHGSGRVNYDIPSRLYFSNPEGWDIVASKEIDKAAEWMRDVSVTCGDYAALFDAPGKDVWIYADPPYFRNSELTPSSQLYQHSFTREDHERFAEVARRCKHNVAISYDDCPEARELFAGWEFIENEWSYCGTTNGEKETGKELLIVNYEPDDFPLLPVVIGDRDEVMEIRDRIVSRGKRALADAIATGCDLLRAKELLGHGNFLPWIEAEFGWSISTANRFIRVAERFVNLTNLPIELSAAYKLAAPSTPEDAFTEAIERAEAGEQITNKLLTSDILGKHKDEPEPPSDDAFVEAVARYITRKLEERPHLQQAIVELLSA